jgi:uncharacterized protein (TIGR02996 family)
MPRAKKPASDPRQPFYNAILDAWDDDAPRLVYADWLDEQGDEFSQRRAALIRLGIQAQPYSYPHKPIPDKLAASLREQENWFSEAFRSRNLFNFEPKWVRGFVEDLGAFPWTMDAFSEAQRAALDDLGPINNAPVRFRASQHRGRPDPECVRLAEEPSLRYWHALDIADNEYSFIGPIGDANFAALVSSSHLGELRRISIEDHARDPRRANNAPLGVKAMKALAANPVLKNVKTLKLWWNGLTDSAVRALAEAKYLRLKDLSLADHFTDAAITALADSPVLDTVESLHVSGPLTGKALRRLLRSEYLKSLHTLDLNGYTSGAHARDSVHYGELPQLLDPVGFRALIESPLLARLNVLRLKPPFGLPESDWDDLAEAIRSMPMLEKLDIYPADQLHDRLSRRCQKLLYEFGNRYRPHKNA